MRKKQQDKQEHERGLGRANEAIENLEPERDEGEAVSGEGTGGGRMGMG